MTRLWEIDATIDPRVLRFTASGDAALDARLVPYDVRASVAHAQMLCEAGYLSKSENEAVAHELAAIADDHAHGTWAITTEDEDVHTAIENQLTQRLGATGARIHLGRSRNDQVLAALRLYLLDAIAVLASGGESVLAALDAIATAQGSVVIPGYTHMQRAMPSSVQLWAEGFRSEIADDIEGLRLCRRRISRNPLGSAAGYGVPVLRVDRWRTTELLGFDQVHEPVTAVQLSRGKAEAEVLFSLALLLQDVGRLAAELCLFATSEFGFVKLPASVTTGSSIMPQKRNPDALELVRASGALICADLLAVLQLTCKLPSGYHRDLQLSKAPLFHGIDMARDTLEALTAVLPEVRFDAERAALAMEPGLYAAEAAYRLVEEQGVPFRDAYRQVAAEIEAQRQRSGS
ncbi:MAG: argininosuccinate lyase [Planctomycetota bacterium]